MLWIRATNAVATTVAPVMEVNRAVDTAGMAALLACRLGATVLG